MRGEQMPAPDPVGGPTCTCNAGINPSTHGPYAKGTGPDPRHCPVHGEPAPVGGLTDTVALAEFISVHLFGHRDGPYMNHEAMAEALVRSEPFQRLIIAAREQGRADLAAKVEALPRTWELHRCGVRGPGLRAAAASLRAVLAADSTPREDATHTHLTVGVTRGCPACEQVAQALPGGES